jgi:hypothetical protein
VPLTKRSDPLSATISPYICMPRKMLRTIGDYEERSLDAFSRNRAPIGSAPFVLPA